MKVFAFVSPFSPDRVAISVIEAGSVSMTGTADGVISVAEAHVLIERLQQTINLLATANTTQGEEQNG